MVAVGIGLILIVVVGLIWLAMLDGDYRVDRSIDIDVPPQRVFDRVRDFRSWKEWSPWLLHEPDTTLVFSDNPDREAGFYHWDGRFVGAGKLTHRHFDVPSRIEQCIEFTRPFHSVCDVGWRFEPIDGGTRVHWLMSGRMPFLFRPMAKSTKGMIEQDYDLGLAMLNGVLDPQAEQPQIAFVGELLLPPWLSLVSEWAGSLADLPAVMQDRFPQLSSAIEQQARPPAGQPFTAYHKVDLKTGQLRCGMAIPVAAGTEPGGFNLQEVGGGRYFRVIVCGSYEFLGMAWHSAMGHLRMHKYKRDCSRPSLEVYENDPRSVDSSNEIRTTLYLPVK